MIVSKTRTDAFIESEENKKKIMALVQEKPLSRSEICMKLNISKVKMHTLLSYLCDKKYLKVDNEYYFCSFSKRTMCSYAPTGLPYVGRDLKEIQERADRNKKHREWRAAQKAQQANRTLVNEAVPKRVEPIVIKVDEHTTIYYNSRRPSSDFKLKKEPKSRRNSKVAIGSGMGMFGSW